MLKKILLFIAIAVIIVLIGCWIYLPSITRYRELKLEEERINKKIQEIDSQIKMLTDERSLLISDVAYLEKVIREELGFVKPGEIVYELVTQKNPPKLSETVSTNSPGSPESGLAVPPAESLARSGVVENTVSVKQSVTAINSAKKSSSTKKKPL